LVSQHHQQILDDGLSKISNEYDGHAGIHRELSPIESRCPQALKQLSINIYKQVISIWAEASSENREEVKFPKR